MSRFTLRNDGYASFKKITEGRKWVGRVAKCADGSFLGIIGRTEVRATTETRAFEEVVAKHCGHESAAALRAQNSAVRAHNAARRATAYHAFDEFASGNMEPLAKILGW
jgi:hypothetical protein